MQLALALACTLTAPASELPTEAGGPIVPSLCGGVQGALGGDTDWVIAAGEVVVFNTTQSLVKGKPVIGGVVGVPISDTLANTLKLAPGMTLGDIAAPAPTATGSGCQLVPSFDTRGAKPVFQATGRRITREHLRYRPGLRFTND